MNQDKPRRRVRFLDGFQYKLTARVGVYWLLYTLFLWNAVICWPLLTGGKAGFYELYARFRHEVAPAMLASLLLVPAFIWDAFRFSHRVAGPIYRVRRIARGIAANAPVVPVQLRDGDELVELEQEFNEMLAALERRGLITIATPARTESAEASGTGALKIAT